MSKQTEALKLALEALEDYVEEYGPHEQDSGVAYAITAIREALAEQQAHESAYQRGYMDGIAKGLRMEQPAQQQEPVKRCMEHGECFGGKCIYTSPPAQRTWVGLTDDEIDVMANDFEEGYVFLYRSFTRAIEAKLREKNA